MARPVARGEIWMLGRAPPDKRRPVLVLTRPALLGLLHIATVVAITSTRRGAPTEVDVGVDEGLKQPSTVSLVHVYTVPQAQLRTYVGTVGAEKMRAVCRALGIAVGCDD